MADIELVVKRPECIELVVRIPEWVYKQAQDMSSVWTDSVWSGIKNGTPLPKGHGRLIDADAFIAMMKDASKRQKYKELLIDERLTVDDVFEAVIASMLNQGITEGDAPTIIEADREV